MYNEDSKYFLFSAHFYDINDGSYDYEYTKTVYTLGTLIKPLILENSKQYHDLLIAIKWHNNEPGTRKYILVENPPELEIDKLLKLHSDHLEKEKERTALLRLKEREALKLKSEKQKDRAAKKAAKEKLTKLLQENPDKVAKLLKDMK